ncbi:unnamed protein product, partial [Symbiodinium microadriaticum]
TKPLPQNPMHQSYVPKPFNKEKEFRKRQLRVQEKVAAFQKEHLGKVDPAVEALRRRATEQPVKAAAPPEPAQPPPQAAAPPEPAQPPPQAAVPPEPAQPPPQVPPEPVMQPKARFEKGEGLLTFQVSVAASVVLHDKATHADRNAT